MSYQSRVSSDRQKMCIRDSRWTERIWHGLQQALRLLPEWIYPEMMDIPVSYTHLAECEYGGRVENAR